MLKVNSSLTNKTSLFVSRCNATPVYEKRLSESSQHTSGRRSKPARIKSCCLLISTWLTWIPIMRTLLDLLSKSYRFLIAQPSYTYLCLSPCLCNLILGQHFCAMSATYDVCCIRFLRCRESQANPQLHTEKLNIFFPFFSGLLCWFYWGLSFKVLFWNKLINFWQFQCIKWHSECWEYWEKAWKGYKPGECLSVL